MSYPIAAAAPIGVDEEPSLASVALQAPKPELPARPSSPPRIERIIEAIGSCEGGSDAHATNPHSSAKGRFQFLDGTWKHYAHELWGSLAYLHDPFDWNDNTELGRYVIETYGTHDWDASASCWKPKLK